MNALLIGSGGREHALAWKLKSSPRLKKLYALPGSAAIGELAERLPGDPTDRPAAVRLCRERSIDLVIVGPEAPLAAGVADALREAGVRVFGPGKDAARLESSKAFAKDFMRRHRIPTAEAEIYDDPYKARDAAAHLELPLVVKADGLAAGKGVRVCSTRREAIEAVRDFMTAKTLGAAGTRVVLEECLEGPEVTVMAFCDGHRLLALPPSRDHKRAGDGDAGPNTGGMGAFAPVALGADVERRIRAEISDRVLAGLAADRLDFRGLLYCGLMLTRQGPKALEFNARFGDPETQAVLPLLKSDLLELAAAAADGDLGGHALQFHPSHAVCVVLASEGYPGTPKTGRAIDGLDSDFGSGVEVFHAGTAKQNDRWTTSGGRVLGVCGSGPSLAAARDLAYAAVKRIRFEGMQFRTDIAASAAADVNAAPVSLRGRRISSEKRGPANEGKTTQDDRRRSEKARPAANRKVMGGRRA